MEKKGKRWQSSREGRQGRCSAKASSREKSTLTGLEDWLLLLVNFLKRIRVWPFTSLPGSKEDEEGLAGPLFSETSILAGTRPPGGAWRLTQGAR